MMWPGLWAGGWFGWLLMSLMMIVFWGGLIGLIVWAVVAVTRGSSPSRSPERSFDAMAVLEERFVRGEIDHEEFQRRREVLRGHGATDPETRKPVNR